MIKICPKLIKSCLIDYLRNEKSENIKQMSGVKKLQWFSWFYRMRIWDYRMWFSIISGKVVLERFLHRKDIYRYYPD